MRSYKESNFFIENNAFNMVEQVQYLMEDMVRELQDYERRNLFTKVSYEFLSSPLSLLLISSL
jgi:hypothetical protein